MSRIRHLRPTDLGDLLELSRIAGWNQTPADWERMMALAPDGCFGIEEGGRLVSSTTAIRYGSELGWIGMVLTHPDYRGRGNARDLLQHAINFLKQQRVRWIKLDATDLGRPIYSRAGFRDEHQVERWKRPAGAGPRIASFAMRPYVVDPSFDRAYFSAYRVPVLNALLKAAPTQASAYELSFGYAMWRPGALATYFGPCVVRGRDKARKLLEWFLSHHHDEDVFWDLIPDNKDAVQLAIDYGFEPSRQLMRMSLEAVPRTPPLLRNNSSVFAIAGFEYG